MTAACTGTTGAWVGGWPTAGREGSPLIPQGEEAAAVLGEGGTWQQRRSRPREAAEEPRRGGAAL